MAEVYKEESEDQILKMSDAYRLVSFSTFDEDRQERDGPHVRYQAHFMVQMFGMNEKGDTIAINVDGFTPFFYIKVSNTWTEREKCGFISQMTTHMGDRFANAITTSKLVQRKGLYGFDAGKLHSFILVKFKSEAAMRAAKNLWYDGASYGDDHKLKPDGYPYREDQASTTLYEEQIPPLLRLFHMQEISPSGWIALPRKKTNYKDVKNKDAKATSCTYECVIQYNHIIPLPWKETPVPFKICSFDIEASSSHGDFPLPVKNYNKLATNIADICADTDVENIDETFLRLLIRAAFRFAEFPNVDQVFPIVSVSEEELENGIALWLLVQPTKVFDVDVDLGLSPIEDQAEDGHSDDEGGGEAGAVNEAGADAGAGAGAGAVQKWNMFKKPAVKRYKKRGSVLDLLRDPEVQRDTQILELTRTLTNVFPKLQGDNVTFIGSTFMRVGEQQPYLNHCIVRDTCSAVDNVMIESYATEKQVLLAWARLIKREDPDIIIGYNIFGFDYQFMYLRAKELKCERAFMQLSRKNKEVCLKYNGTLEETTLSIASGQHVLKFPKLTGRLQIDLYNYLRREFILGQYKLDYVSGHFIGDYVKKIEWNTEENYTLVYSKNLQGLDNFAFVTFGEESHTVDLYKNGQKFPVHHVNASAGTFRITGLEQPDKSKKIRWGLAKDDVTPQDIFRMTNEGPDQRAIIAKYCIQDCNLVHQIFKKIDVLTGCSEMAKLCSVPLDFIVLRGQGIKLTSYIAKKCREKGTLMPVLDKADSNEGYEGATVLEPKCNLYLDDPVACNDYKSLYPSAMISENISHDSKVWTREFDLQGNLVCETGETNADGLFLYDNLPGYTYVNIEYNSYKWQHKGGNPKAAMEKVKSGTKVCRFAQFPKDPNTGAPVRAIMPAILEELLSARQATRDQIKTEPDEFMKNILDKRQLSIKVTANSLYGQTGAKTSSFYDKDCAASTTAMGRKFLTYGQRILEECFHDTTVETKTFGPVHTMAEYVYGDTDSVFFKFNLTDMEGNKIIGDKALEITIELAQQVGELATMFLKWPHDWEYEKTFLPFCLLSKKRYAGMLYEFSITSCKWKSMGIVLQRRDNAPIVKDIYGGVIDILMKEKNVEQAIQFLRVALQNMLDGNCPLDKLIITKALRSGYKNPKQIAHKVLADRIGKRDPGNKPSVGDRIPYVFVENSDRKALQGERIETPEYIQAKKLKINYAFYITNQIMKPLQQLFGLVLEQMKEFKKKKGSTLHKWQKELQALRDLYPNDAQYRKKEEALRNKEVKALLFDSYLRQLDNIKAGNASIAGYFAKC